MIIIKENISALTSNSKKIKRFKDTKESKDSQVTIKALIKEIEKARLDIEAAEMNFECVSKKEEVDVIVYELRRAQTRYCALLEKFKNMSDV